MLFAFGADTAIAILGCVGFILLVVLIIAIYFHITLMKALQACAFRNQKMPPGLVWLRFVPILHFFWPFVNVVQVGNSLQAEFRDRGLQTSDKSFGKTLGVSYYTAVLLGIALNFGGRLLVEASGSDEPALYVGGLALILCLVQLVLFILYWMTIAGFVRELNSHGRPDDRYDYDRDDRDYERDYDRRRHDDDDTRRDRDDHDRERH